MKKQERGRGVRGVRANGTDTNELPLFVQFVMFPSGVITPSELAHPKESLVHQSGNAARIGTAGAKVQQTIAVAGKNP